MHHLNLNLRLPILPLLFLAVITLLTTSLVQAHRIDIPAGEKACFFEDLHVEDQMTITYQVGAGGNMDIDFYLQDPTSATLSSIYRKSTGTYALTAAKDGRYTYCFSNEMSSVSPKVVSFNVHGVLYVEDSGEVAPVEAEIRALSTGLQGVKDEQEYIVVRERVHRDTAESTNDRVKWWSIVQSFLLVAICAWNVTYLKSWFEVKRVL
ncbi:supernatant protein factor, C-terminal domain-containing protein [Filobasidium floriforme]|uniref:supernatant protein factor, C-terminal domain-containing protein n=1 Tax=Filobasidium floriforme TaxID=5210 RepID=UPI001E8D62B0|nr:supernatant protein factor, C-terminal domain-containing protein [Filobasidium floriforme]KAH8085267.1 supernatant protein factor, C-terminal domain-containing protein [Filobasidium floriforme]